MYIGRSVCIVKSPSNLTFHILAVVVVCVHSISLRGEYPLKKLPHLYLYLNAFRASVDYTDIRCLFKRDIFNLSYSLKYD